MSFEFARQFDGTQPEIPEAEIAHITKIFNSTFEDKMLGNIDHMSSHGSDRLGLKNEHKGGKVHISLVDNHKSQTTLRYIHLQKINEDGTGGESIDYNLGRDGVVRRADILLPDHPAQIKLRQRARAAEKLQSDYLRGRISGDELMDGIATDLPHVLQEAQIHAANQELETAMGVNNQPIGIDEMEALAELVRTAEVK